MQSSEGKARVDSTMRDEAKRAFGFSGERVKDDQQLIAMRDYRYLRCVLSGTVPSVPTHHLSTSFGPRAFSRGILISALLFSKRFMLGGSVSEYLPLAERKRHTLNADSVVS
jgi:hypothetical protein